MEERAGLGGRMLPLALLWLVLGIFAFQFLAVAQKALAISTGGGLPPTQFTDDVSDSVGATAAQCHSTVAKE